MKIPSIPVISLLSALIRPALGCALLLLLPVAGAHAQATKIFVASFGNDANDGSRGAPKRNFQAAHDAVAAGGQIVVLDTAGYGALSINKSIAVTVPPGVNGFVTVTGGASGVTITGGVNDVVSLRGLIVEGGGSAPNGGYGINFFIGTLRIEDCTVRNFTVGVRTNSGNPVRMLMNNSRVFDTQYGIVVAPVSTTFLANLTGCQIDNASQVAVTAIGVLSIAQLTVKDCEVTQSERGFQTQGSGASIVVDNCTISGGTYAFYKEENAGIIYTRGNNTISFITGPLINGKDATTPLPAY